MSGFTAPVAQADWVIIGMRHGDRCVLYASRTLTHVQLQVHAQFDSDVHSWDSVETWRVPTYVEAQLEFHDYVTVTGASYASCLQRLFTMGEPGHWREPQTPEIRYAAEPDLAEGPRALGSG